MRQFKTILKFELKGYLKNKAFVGITLFLVIALAAVMFFPRIAALFESDSDSTDTADRPVMLVKADSDDTAELAKETFQASFADYEVVLTDDTEEQIKSNVTEGSAECAFVMTSPTSYTYFVDDLSMYDMNTETANAVLQEVYRLNAMIQSGMTPDQAGEIMSVQIQSEVMSLGKNQMENFFYTYIMIFALYMVILLYGQMVATNVATEKSSRAMEVLITSAKPTAMMFGKVIASCLAGLIQLVAIFGASVLFYNLNKAHWGDNQIIASIFDMPVDLLVFMLIFFILGFFIYAFLYGAIGSTASKLEDINTSVMPITFMFIIAFFVVIFSMSSGSVDNTLMLVCSYVPFTSPMAMFTRIAMSTVPWYEVVISIAILIGSVIGVGVLSAKIYRVGVVMYGTTPKLGSIIKAIRKS